MLGIFGVQKWIVNRDWVLPLAQRLLDFVKGCLRYGPPKQGGHCKKKSSPNIRDPYSNTNGLLSMCIPKLTHDQQLAHR